MITILSQDGKRIVLAVELSLAKRPETDETVVIVYPGGNIIAAYPNEEIAKAVIIAVKEAVGKGKKLYEMPKGGAK